MPDYSLCVGTKKDLCQTCLRKTDPKILVHEWRTWFTHKPIKDDNTCELYLPKVNSSTEESISSIAQKEEIP